MRTVRVNASRAYDVVIGEGLLSEAGERISSVSACRKAVIVSDDNVFAIYGRALIESLEKRGISCARFVFPHGERSKNLSVYGELLEYMCQMRLTRQDAVVALGGGVTGDLAGFAASTYQRGTGFIQLPTSLLAAVDSSVGGKTALDLNGGKNQVGSFYQPMLVLCDLNTLKTLPSDEYTNGCAEVIKYAMIGSEEMFNCLDETPVSAQYEDIIGECVAMKRDYVEKDERDTGVRAFLNFGHSFGHSFELLSGYSIPHGRAVAMGMAAIARAAVRLGVCEGEALDRLIALLDKYSLPVRADFDPKDVARACLSDKKAAQDGIRLIVPERIGTCRVQKVPSDEIIVWAEAGLKS